MNGVFVDDSLPFTLNWMILGMPAITVRLAQNTVAITRTSKAQDFIEATFSGYAPKTLYNAAPPVFDPANHLASTTFGAMTWQNTTGAIGNAIYAVYFTEPGGKLIYAEECAGAPSNPIDMGSAGKTYVYTPLWQHSSQFTVSP